MVGERTMETFWSVILLNVALSIMCIMWTKTHCRSSRLPSGNSANNVFMPSMRLRGVGSDETFSNLGVKK